MHNHKSEQSELMENILKSALKTAQLATSVNDKSLLDDAELVFVYEVFNGAPLFRFGFSGFVPSIMDYNTILKFLTFFTFSRKAIRPYDIPTSVHNEYFETINDLIEALPSDSRLARF